MKPIVCIPCGRRRHLEVLVPYLLRERKTYKYVMLWDNVWEDKDDKQYIRDLAAEHRDTFMLKVLPNRETDAVKGEFYPYDEYYQFCEEPGQMYIKMDDDIVWMARGAISKLASFRRQNREYLAVVGNIVNNTYCNVEHQRLGALPKDVRNWRPCNRYSSDPVGHYDVGWVQAVHDSFLAHADARSTKEFLFERIVVEDYFRAPNHVYAYYGDEIPYQNCRATSGKVAHDEMWLTTTLAESLERPVCFCGSALFVHYAYTPQRKHLDSVNMLERYKERARKDCPDTAA